MLATTRHPQLHNPSNFLPETYATGAENAPCHVGGDQWSQILICHHPLGFGIA